MVLPADSNTTDRSATQQSQLKLVGKDVGEVNTVQIMRLKHI